MRMLVFFIWNLLEFHHINVIFVQCSLFGLHFQLDLQEHGKISLQGWKNIERHIEMLKLYKVGVF
jgi:hypothetical protein